MRYPKSLNDLAIESIVVATEHAQKGDSANMEQSLKEAKIYSDMHSNKLSMQGRHDESKVYKKGLDDHYSRIRNICKAVSDDLSVRKSADDFSTKPKYGYNTGSIENMKVKRPSKDARYDYKAFGDLHPEDRTAAVKQYVGGRPEAHEYPVDKQSGRLVNGKRVPSPQSEKASIAKPNKTSYGTGIKPRFQEGMAVRVKAEGPHKGKLGIVRRDNPAFPGRTMVQVGHKDFMVDNFHESDLEHSHPQSRVEKAMITLWNIEKAFRKVA